MTIIRILINNIKDINYDMKKVGVKNKQLLYVTEVTSLKWTVLCKHHGNYNVKTYCR